MLNNCAEDVGYRGVGHMRNDAHELRGVVDIQSWYDHRIPVPADPHAYTLAESKGTPSYLFTKITTAYPKLQENSNALADKERTI